MATFGDHPPLPDSLESLLGDKTVSTLFLKADCPPRVKTGHITELRLEDIESEKWDKPTLESLGNELITVIEQHNHRSDCFVEIEREGCRILQAGDLRITCAWPPFSDAWEITVVRPVAHLTLADYELDPRLIRRLSDHHRGVFVVGKPGSGKTTSLYAGLKEISDRSQNILTIEDPVEYALDGIGQTQVNNKTGLTFAKGLRAILRQDPDIVMVGEIRDKETAEIAIQASLTGHLVLSTVHTNSAVNAITRLRDMGIEPYLLSSSLVYVLSQRLVRCLCEKCKVIDDESSKSKILQKYNVKKTIYKAVGCSKCENTGFKGRLSIGEFILMDEKISELIYRSSSENEISEYVFANNKKLFENGILALEDGKTSLSELLRITEE